MCRVIGQRASRRPDLFGYFVEILVVDGVHGLAVPISHPTGRDGKTYVIERLEQVGTDLVRTILVAYYGDDRHFAVDPWPALLIGLRDLRIQTFECLLRDAGRMPKPDRSGDEQNIGRHEALPN